MPEPIQPHPSTKQPLPNVESSEPLKEHDDLHHLPQKTEDLPKTEGTLSTTTTTASAQTSNALEAEEHDVDQKPPETEPLNTSGQEDNSLTEESQHKEEKTHHEEEEESDTTIALDSKTVSEPQEEVSCSKPKVPALPEEPMMVPTLETPDLSKRNINNLFDLIELLLKNRALLFAYISQKRHLPEMIPNLLLIILLCTIPVGAILGSYAGGWQILYAAIKIPLLLLLTLAVCFATFWTWSIYFRTQLHSMQIAALSLASIALTSLLLLGASPFLWLVLGDSSTHYHRAITSIVAVFSVAGFCGVNVLYQGLLTLSAQVQNPRSGGLKVMSTVWISIYGWVGLQMAWLLRPYLFHPWANNRPLTFVRSLEGNVYDSIWRTLLTALGII